MRKGLVGFSCLCLLILFCIQIAIVEKSEAQDIAGGYYHTLAVKWPVAVNPLWAWGYNLYGQVGDGTAGGPDMDRTSPMQVVGPTYPDAGFLTSVYAVSAGYHSLALKQDGTVWAWGKNDYGQIGNGTSGTIRT